MKFCSSEQRHQLPKAIPSMPMPCRATPCQTESKNSFSWLDWSVHVVLLSIRASVWGERNGGEGVEGEGSVTALHIRVQSAVSPVWSLTEPNSCVYHKSRAATAPTSGGIFTEMQRRVFLLLRSQWSLASVQLLVTAVFFSDTFLLAFVFVFSLPQPSLVFWCWFASLCESENFLHFVSWSREEKAQNSPVKAAT